MDNSKELREEAVKMLLSSIPEEDSERKGLLGTPDRVARMYDELFKGYSQNPEAILSKQFEMETEEPEEYTTDSIVEVKDIFFSSICEHHIMPFFGTVSVRYKPVKGGKVVGISKLARLVECYARRLQIQERMGRQICLAIASNMDCSWVSVDIEAVHTCMMCRGVNRESATTVTHTEWSE